MSPQLLRNGLLVLLAVMFVMLAVWITNDLDGNNKLASLAGLLIALATLAVTIIGLFPTDMRSAPNASDLANDLANTVGKEWYEEARVRRLRDPKVLPLNWSTGRMEGKFDEVTHQLADGYRQVSSGRLVVLGEPGSGKTVLAILLTLGLLNSRRVGAEVPVLLSVSSWDPMKESMDDWIIRTVATSYYNGQQDSPRALLDHGLLLPILDGLDEIPESALRSAVRGINEAVGADRPIVVTCRSAEYDDVIEGGAPALRQAPVIRVRPVAVADVIAYLKAVPSWPNGTSWEAVFDDLKRRPGSPLAAALSTPLMVSLTRTIYQRCGGNPAELLDAKTFGSRHTVEDYLVDRVIDAAYAPDPLPSGEPATASANEWDATKARRWLTFLARYLHQHRERDLAWWRMSDRLVSVWLAPVIGIALGVALMMAVSAGVLVMGSEDYYASTIGLLFGAVVGAVVALLGTVLWYSGAGSTPGRMAFAVPGSLGRLRRGFTAGAALVAFLAVPVLLLLVGYNFAADPTNFISFDGIVQLTQELMVAAAVACVVGLAMAAHHWLNALPERSAQASPFSFVQQDCRSSLVGALAAGAVAGLTLWPALNFAIWIGAIISQGIAGLLGEIRIISFTGAIEFGSAPIATIGIVVVLPGVVVVMMVLLTRAWPRFVLARVVLAARGHLPWRLLPFLADARDRELLRQSGGMYQFRHIRLQERLATSPDIATTSTRRLALTPTTAKKRRRIMAMVGVGVIASTAVITLSTFNYQRCESFLHLGTDVDRVRFFTDSGSLCIGIVPESEWNQLGPDQTVLDQLKAGNEDAVKESNKVTIAVLGAFHAADPGTREVILRQLYGVVLAQHESERLGQPVHIILVDTGLGNHTDASSYYSEEAAWARVASFDGRPGVNLSALVTLGGTSYYGPLNYEDGSLYKDYGYTNILEAGDEIPILTAGFGYTTDSDSEIPSLLTRAGFDQKLRESVMLRFIQDSLKSEVLFVQSKFPLDVNDMQWCADAEWPVLVYKEPDVQFDLLPSHVNTCGTGRVRLVTTDSSVAESIQRFPARSYPNLTIYYPVAQTTPTARRCEDVVAQVFPSRAGRCTDTDAATDLSYQATLNAVGKGNLVVQEMRPDQNRWITIPARR